MKIILNNLSATKKLAKKIAKVIPHNFVIAMSGELGSGKTTLVREILHNFGVTDMVKSPTFTYVEPYFIFPNIRIYHFDLYRFNDVEDWFNLGFDEYLMEPSICFIEWYEKANELLPNIDWKINLHHVWQNKLEQQIKNEQKNEQKIREVKIDAISLLGMAVLEKLIMLK